MALYSRVAAGPLGDKPLPSLPSPTLTNPDMVLPDDMGAMLLLPSPARTLRRPPSPSYLRDKTNEHAGSQMNMVRERQMEKRGLMSRKMMLERSHTGSYHVQAGPRSVKEEEEEDDRDHGHGHGHEHMHLASSPTLRDTLRVGSLRSLRRPSAGTSSVDSSDDMTSMPSFVSRYDNIETTDDDFTDTEGLASQTGMTDAQRKVKEEEEQASALLSQRAEEILANAKKRLNLMEGNLRGARDLVAPLTAANLKRATSLGSSITGVSYAQRRLESMDYDDDFFSTTPRLKMLHAQASLPAIGRDFQAHSRTQSNMELPERPHTALARSGGFPKVARIPVKPSDPSLSGALRTMRSLDSLGINTMTTSRDRQLHYKNSPDSNLETLQEDGGPYVAGSTHSKPSDSSSHSTTLGLGLDMSKSGSSTTSEDLRDQMTNLKGKISSLRERAREDSLRRQSMNNLRTASPLNNATYNAPEIWYNESSDHNIQPIDTNPELDHSAKGSPEKPPFADFVWQPGHAPTGSRNAFAEQAARANSRGTSRGKHSSGSSSSEAERHSPPRLSRRQHRKTPSGTAIIDPARKRYTHHRYSTSRDVPGAFDAYDTDGSEGDLLDVADLADYDEELPPLLDDEIPEPDYNHVISDLSEAEMAEGASVYEDDAAEVDAGEVIAHEDREDAFDYEHFFLHSAMGSYNTSQDSSDSDDASVSSAETARAPQPIFDYDLGQDDFDEPPTPSTPLALRDIEARLQHTRSISNESFSTLATFATADEGRTTPMLESGRASRMEWPDNPPPIQRSSSRPGTAVRRTGPTLTAETDDSSDRADSGVGGLPRRPGSGHDRSMPKSAISAVSASSSTLSPPISPTTPTLQDPTAMAVRALLDPAGKSLGLKDKAVLFTLIESLRRVCVRLQEEDESQYESRILRRRLDEARKVLDGLSVSDGQ